MSIKRVFFVAAFMLMAAINFSCENESTAQVDELYGIDRDEIKEEDT